MSDLSTVTPPAPPAAAETKSDEGVVVVRNLTFAYPGRDNVLNEFNLNLSPGARCLLIGANGAGKSTLLKILGGRHLTKPDGAVTILDRDPFRDTRLNFERSYLDTDWGMRTVAFAGYGCPLQADIPVNTMMLKLQEEYPERRQELIDLLGIDMNWRMHQVSDGQRRRVQIFLGLIRPFKILLLDEVTVSLDVIVRMDLLNWLKKESETRGAIIIYATHIFDGLDDWPTHLHYLTHKGSTGWQGRIETLDIYKELRTKGHPSPLLQIAVSWLRKDLKEKQEQGGNKFEKASGTSAINEADPTQNPYDNAGGGFSNGRMAAYNNIGSK